MMLVICRTEARLNDSIEKESPGFDFCCKESCEEIVVRVALVAIITSFYHASEI